ncbi:putative glycoside hydrolase [Corynebacterium sp. TAE3-ERU16]|uniref:putative glycoside hydrolase n=1 Tax=Corynebacterium sp. TAE3-ERU16 TaxID=2849493 RepID=UPI001C49614A|nr:putative glycoside hydrolase family 15 protein [Corynebacterium sp. TAE3-ERU16]
MKPRPRLAWIRYGGPLTEAQLALAARRYRAVILQPWETRFAEQLKARNSDVTVLAYQCLSSIRTYEPGPVYSSGLPPAEARALDTCARRLDGSLIEWARYPGHLQQRVWDPRYRAAWVEAVVANFRDSPFDGVMADNDVFDDYYDLCPPLEGGTGLPVIRDALDRLVCAAGRALNDVDKVLVPNIAESRREEGRWRRHSRYGGGLEECWMAWGTTAGQRLDTAAVLAQVESLTAPGLTIARTPGTGHPGDPYLTLALAAAWVFAPTSDLAVTATDHDGYDAAPWTELVDLDLGDPCPEGVVELREGVYGRRLTRGRAVINLCSERVYLDSRWGGESLDPWRGVICSDH